MGIKALTTALMLLAATPLAAQDSDRFTLGGDAYVAGGRITVSDAGLSDVFAAGNRLTLKADISGSAHLAGRSIDIGGRVGGNVYAAGMDVDLDAPVAGNATLMGNSVTVSEPVTGNLRVMASDVSLTAPIAGSAIIAGETVDMNAKILGDLALTADDILWGDDAGVDGTLHIYADDVDSIEVPARVAPADRVQFHPTEAWSDMADEALPERPGFWGRLGALLGGVIVTTLVATLIAAIAPGFVATLRARALDRPARTLWMGALGLATATGATVVVAMTGIGIILTPFTILTAVLLGLAGYVLGAYLLGVWAVEAVGQGVTDSTLDRAIAAFVGAGLLAIVALVPFVGWLAVMAVLLIGVGALMIRLFAPRFRTAEA